MSTLIRDKQIVTDDGQVLAEDAVRLPNTADIAQVWPQISKQPLIVLEFPSFADGRAYSQASALRQLGFAGEIRATGAAVVRDQLHGMARCGINSFELRADQDAESCLKAFADFSLSYQPAADGEQLIFRRRA